MEIREVGKKTVDSVKKNPVLIGGLIFLGLFVVSLAIQKSGEEADDSPVKIEGAYSSYPDATTNANVIIDTLEQSIDFSREQLTGDMNDNFEYTNSLIEGNTELLNDLTETNSGILDAMESLPQEAETRVVTQYVYSDNSAEYQSKIADLNKQLSEMNANYKNLQNESYSQVNALKKELTEQQSKYVNEAKNYEKEIANIKNKYNSYVTNSQAKKTGVSKSGLVGKLS